MIRSTVVALAMLVLTTALAMLVLKRKVSGEKNERWMIVREANFELNMSVPKRCGEDVLYMVLPHIKRDLLEIIGDAPKVFLFSLEEAMCRR